MGHWFWQAKTMCARAVAMTVVATQGCCNFGQQRACLHSLHGSSMTRDFHGMAESGTCVPQVPWYTARQTSAQHGYTLGCSLTQQWQAKVYRDPIPKKQKKLYSWWWLLLGTGMSQAMQAIYIGDNSCVHLSSLCSSQPTFADMLPSLKPFSDKTWQLGSPMLS